MLKDGKKKKKKGGAAEATAAGVDTALDFVKLAKEPSVANAGSAIASLGAAAVLAPPPAGPIIGGVLMLAGGLMTIFAPHEPSAEELLLNEVLTKLDEVAENQELML